MGKTASSWKVGTFCWLFLIEGRLWKESLKGTFRLIFTLYTGVVAWPVMFLLQALMIMQLSDHNTEQGRGSLCSLKVAA